MPQRKNLASLGPGENKSLIAHGLQLLAPPARRPDYSETEKRRSMVVRQHAPYNLLAPG